MIKLSERFLSILLALVLIIGTAVVPAYAGNAAGTPAATAEKANVNTAAAGGGKFTDTAGHKYETYINKAAELSLFSGFDDGSFRPDATVTRAQFVTVLWRMKGSRVSEVSLPFTDISGINDSYKKAIAWAYENNVVNGTTDTTFDPSGVITRQQALTILYRLDGENSGLETMFTSLYGKSVGDYYNISTYAKKGVIWALYNGIAEAEDGKLQPKAGCSRALLSVYLVKYLGEDEQAASAQAAANTYSLAKNASVDSSLTVAPGTGSISVTLTGDFDENTTYIAVLVKGSAALPTSDTTLACDIKTIAAKDVTAKSITFSLQPQPIAESTPLTLAIVSTDIAFSAKTVALECTVK